METIVVGTDFSPAANNAVNYAVALAKYFRAMLILVNSYALPMSGYDVMMPLDMLPALGESSVRLLKETKDRIIR